MAAMILVARAGAVPHPLGDLPEQHLPAALPAESQKIGPESAGHMQSSRDVHLATGALYNPSTFGRHLV